MKTATGDVLFARDRQRWLAEVERLEPVLVGKMFPAECRLEAVADPSAFLGWAGRPVDGEVAGAVGPGGCWLDFGGHRVGRLRFAVSGVPADAQFLAAAGEVLAEVCENPEAFPGRLGGEWLRAKPLASDPSQAGQLVMPDRRAARYVRLQAVDAQGLGVPFTLDRAEFDAQSAAPFEDPPLPPDTSDADRLLDAVSLQTLRNCMHQVFEDGPKRDRRLWLGDLYLQARANYVSFNANDLVKRCLYLFAATAHDDGIVSPCVFERPGWHGNHKVIPSYAWLLGPTLLDYARATGDFAAAADLWPAARHQQTLFERFVDADGLFAPPAGAYWHFIDWHEKLHPLPAEQAVAVHGLGALATLAAELGDETEAAALRRRRQELVDATRARFLDTLTGLLVAGPDRQAAWASVSWATIAGVLSEAEAQRAFAALEDLGAAAVPPVTPFMQHMVVEALLACGMRDAARARVDAVCGQMLRRGADTFWEVFDPHDERRSPYGSHLHNSYCHAWSCTPTIFVRQGLLPAGSGS